MITLDPKVSFALAVLSTAFNDAMNQTVQGLDYPKIATDVPVAAYKTRMPFLSGRPRMRERHPSARMDERNLVPTDYEVQTTEFYDNVGVEKRVLRNDGYGVYLPQLTDLAAAVPRHKEETAFSMLTSNEAIGYDDQPIFSANHPVADDQGNEVDQSNILNEDLTKQSLNDAIALLPTFRNPAGQKFGARAQTLVVGEAIGPEAWELLYLSPAGASAPTYAGTQIKNFVVSPYVGPEDWFVMDASREMKPILIPYRTDQPIEQYDDRDDPKARRDGEFHFTVEAEYGFNAGAWQLIVGSLRT